MKNQSNYFKCKRKTIILIFKVYVNQRQWDEYIKKETYSIINLDSKFLFKKISSKPKLGYRVF